MNFNLILLLSVVSVGGIGYQKYQNMILEKDIVDLEYNNKNLKNNQIQMSIAKDRADKSLLAAEKNQRDTEVAMTGLINKNQQLQKEKDIAMKVFRDHNLTRLARIKPDTIERLANAKTAQVFKDLENDTKEIMGLDDAITADRVPE